VAVSNSEGLFHAHHFTDRVIAILLNPYEIDTCGSGAAIAVFTVPGDVTATIGHEAADVLATQIVDANFYGSFAFGTKGDGDICVEGTGIGSPAIQGEPRRP
jgi:hypothetical protein